MGGEHHESKKTYGLMYYVKSAVAGGLCCSVTHGSACPIDVVKTRMQLNPAKYNGGMIQSFKTVIAEEGVGALATGLGPTAVGYFVQGWFKFGGVEFFKIQMAGYFGDVVSWNNRTAIYLASSACAEFIADIFLCPLEATRIRLVADPKFANGLLTAFPKIIQQDGVVKGFYSGFGPILFKQVPYTMAKFSVQSKAAEVICAATGADTSSVAVSLSSGVIAGIAAAVVSHPADTLLSMISKNASAGGSGSIASRLINLAKEAGVRKLCITGLGTRCIMIGSLTAGQFGIFDTVMRAVGAEKYHFHPPAGQEAQH